MIKTSDYRKDASHSHQTPAWMIHAALQQKLGANYRFFEKIYDRELQKAGVDLLAHMGDGRTYEIELKTLRRDPVAQGERDALPLETFSNIEARTPGFLLQGLKHTRYVLWVFQDTERAVLLPFKTLAATFRRKFRKWKRTYHVGQQRTRGIFETYRSECVFVPVKVIEREMQAHLNRYGGTFATN